MVTLLGALIVWVGYDLTTYGWSQLRGCNASLKDVSLPNAWSGNCNPDSAGQAGTGGPDHSFWS